MTTPTGQITRRLIEMQISAARITQEKAISVGNAEIAMDAAERIDRMLEEWAQVEA